jgi:hypothetical protein
MEKKFIKTTDEKTASQMLVAGFQLVSHVGNIYTFINQHPKNFNFDVIDKKSRYPLMDRRLNLFSLYQSYLDNVKVQEWYIEQFNNPTETKQKSYYTLVKFD